MLKEDHHSPETERMDEDDKLSENKDHLFAEILALRAQNRELKEYCEQFLAYKHEE